MRRSLPRSTELRRTGLLIIRFFEPNEPQAPSGVILGLQHLSTANSPLPHLTMSSSKKAATEHAPSLADTQGELESFLNDLPRYCEKFQEETDELLTIIDETIAEGRKAVDEREKNGIALRAREKITISLMKRHLGQLEKERCTIASNQAPSVMPDLPVSSGSPNTDIANHILPDIVASTQTQGRPPAKGRTLSGLFKPNDSLWDQRLNELRAYKEVHGHCNVIFNDKTNKTLSICVSKQRREYGKYKDCKSSSMTKERIKALEQIGFQWMLRPPRADGPRVAWEVRFEQLKQYQLEHGDCNVPKKYTDNPKLGRWVDSQRRHYHLLMKGQPSYMTRGRIIQLNSIGFKWVLGRGNGSRT